MRKRNAIGQPIGMAYGALLLVQGAFYLQSLSPDLLEVGGKWEAPVCYSILFICMACIWFHNIWKLQTEWMYPRKIKWILWIAGVMQVFPIYYWRHYDQITLYIGSNALQPAAVCMLAHGLFLAVTLGLLIGTTKYR